MGALKKSSTLLALDLRKHRFSDSGLLQLGEAVAKNCTLAKLVLKEFEHPVQELCGRTPFMHLQLVDRKLDAQDLALMRCFLAENTATESLNLGENGFGSAGACSLADAFGDHKGIVTLQLYQNQLFADGAIAIGRLLQENRSLEVLRLDDNAIEDRGAFSIAEALKVTTTLQHLYLSDDTVGAAGVQAIADALVVAAYGNGGNGSVNGKSISLVQLTLGTSPLPVQDLLGSEPHDKRVLRFFSVNC